MCAVLLLEARLVVAGGDCGGVEGGHLGGGQLPVEDVEVLLQARAQRDGLVSVCWQWGECACARVRGVVSLACHRWWLVMVME